VVLSLADLAVMCQKELAESGANPRLQTVAEAKAERDIESAVVQNADPESIAEEEKVAMPQAGGLAAALHGGGPATGSLSDKYNTKGPVTVLAKPVVVEEAVKVPGEWERKHLLAMLKERKPEEITPLLEKAYSVWNLEAPPTPIGGVLTWPIGWDVLGPLLMEDIDTDGVLTTGLSQEDVDALCHEMAPVWTAHVNKSAQLSAPYFKHREAPQELGLLQEKKGDAWTCSSTADSELLCKAKAYASTVKGCIAVAINPKVGIKCFGSEAFSPTGELRDADGWTTYTADRALVPGVPNEGETTEGEASAEEAVVPAETAEPEEEEDFHQGQLAVTWPQVTKTFRELIQEYYDPFFRQRVKLLGGYFGHYDPVQDDGNAMPDPWNQEEHPEWEVLRTNNSLALRDEEGFTRYVKDNMQSVLPMMMELYAAWPTVEPPEEVVEEVEEAAAEEEAAGEVEAVEAELESLEEVVDEGAEEEAAAAEEAAAKGWRPAITERWPLALEGEEASLAALLRALPTAPLDEDQIPKLSKALLEHPQLSCTAEVVTWGDVQQVFRTAVIDVEGWDGWTDTSNSSHPELSCNYGLSQKIPWPYVADLLKGEWRMFCDEAAQTKKAAFSYGFEITSVVPEEGSEHSGRAVFMFEGASSGEGVGTSFTIEDGRAEWDAATGRARLRYVEVWTKGGRTAQEVLEAYLEVHGTFCCDSDKGCEQHARRLDSFPTDMSDRMEGDSARYFLGDLEGADKQWRYSVNTGNDRVD